MELFDSPLNSSRAKQGSQEDQLVGNSQDGAREDRDVLQHLGNSHPQKPQRARLLLPAPPREGPEIPKGSSSPGKSSCCSPPASPGASPVNSPGASPSSGVVWASW